MIADYEKTAGLPHTRFLTGVFRPPPCSFPAPFPGGLLAGAIDPHLAWRIWPARRIWDPREYQILRVTRILH
jgi:hypothetical protein